MLEIIFVKSKAHNLTFDTVGDVAPDVDTDEA
jgi:hypothetical protein